MSLQKKAIGGVFWTVVDTFVLKGLSFIAMIILARWLGPAEFGLMGMIAVFIAIGNSITDSGLSSSLIRNKEVDDQDFSTVFILNLALSGIMYTLAFIGAPYIADFFGQPILKNVVRVYCLVFILSAFSAVQLARLTSEMKFKRIAELNIPGTVIGTIVGLVLGYYGFGIWSIIWMYLSIQVIKTVSLWVSSSWRPKIEYSKKKAKIHYGFGYKLMLSGLLDTIFQNSYNIVIGKFYNARDLGFFERSKSFNDYPVTTITGVISRVTFPLLSSLQEDKVRISAVYKKLMRLTFFLTTPLMMGAAAIAYPLFELILGNEWVEAVPFFQILCLGGMFYPIHAFNLNVFKVYGRSDLFLKLEIIKKLIIGFGILIGFQFGIIGLVWSSVITNYLALFVNTYYSSDMINYSSLDQFKDMVPTLLTSGLMFVMVYCVLEYVSLWNLFSQIAIGGGVGVVSYLLINKLFKSKPLFYLLSIIKEKRFI